MAPGDAIFHCDPFAHVVSSRYHETLCDECFVSAEDASKHLKRCSGCQYCYYCSRECQTASWNRFHSSECTYLKLKKPPSDTIRLLARIIFRLNSNPVLRSNGSARNFSDLESHVDNIKCDEKRVEAFVAYLAVLKQCILDGPLPSPSEIFEIYGKVLINSFNIMNMDHHCVGIGIYLEASVLDHSCLPNAIAIFEGKRLFVRSISDKIHMDSPGSDIRISYIDIIERKEERRRCLRELYYFDCYCHMCAKILNDDVDDAKIASFACVKCLSSNSVRDTSDSQICGECHHIMDVASYERYVTIRKNITSKTLFNNKKTYEDLEEAYAKLNNVLGDNDLFMVRLRETLMDERLKNKNWNGAFDVGRRLEAPYNKFYPKFDVNKAMMYLKNGKIALYLGRIKEAARFISLAHRQLLVTHGRHHSIYSIILKDLEQQIDMELKFHS